MGKKKKNKNDPQQQLINLQAQQLAAQVANWAAQLDFQKERFRLLELPQFQNASQLAVDEFAWKKAMDTWDRAYQEASLTGTYNGQPTIQWLTEQARLTGTYNGQRTLEGLLTDAQIKDMQDKMKLANDQFLASTTGYFNGQKTFDREKFETSTAMDAWKFIAGLTGASNAFKQARAIGSMPGGIEQMMQGFAGQYFLPASTSVGSSGGHFNVNDMMQGYGGNQPAAPVGTTPGAVAAPGPMPVPPGPVAPPAPNPTQVPTPVPPMPTTPVPPGGFAPVPGRGFAPSTWNDATRQAVAAWEAAHPGYKLDGSQLGYYITDPTLAAQNPLPNVYKPPPPPPPGPTPPGMVGIQSPAAAASEGVLYSPGGVQAPTDAYNYSPNRDGSAAVYPPGVASPPQTPDVSSYVPLTPQQAGEAAKEYDASLAAVKGPAYVYPGSTAELGPFNPFEGDPRYPASGINQPYRVGGTAGSAGALLPNQINARNYDNSFQYQRDLLWAKYADEGWDPDLAQEAFMKSLPKYGGPSRGAFAF